MRRLIGLAALAILLVLYLATLQTIPNGSEHYYMIDVGETQNVLNQWGTLHATGYPLYVVISNVLVAGLRSVGVDAATAPGVTSLIYGMVAMVLIFVLAAHVLEPDAQTLPYDKKNDVSLGARYRHLLLAGGMVVVYGLTRTVWVHSSIAEVYSFGLMILAGLLLIALWRRPISGRVYWLALLGGIGAFHHRAIGMAGPALVYAAWWAIVGDSQTPIRQVAALPVIVKRVGISLVLGLLGFLQYVYLPLRANAGAKWVYGEPGTWNGFWDQFLGREASRFIGTATTNAGLMANFNLVNGVLITDVTVAGLVLGLAGLVVALRNPARRKVAITMLLSGGVAYGFHVLVYTDILSALILPVTLALAFGWLLLAEWIWKKAEIIFYHRDTKNTETQRQWGVIFSTGWLVLVAGSAVYLVGQNLPFIREMTTNRTGLETIELAKGTPDGAVLMLDWGPRYYAAAFAQDLLGALPNVTLVTHKADFKQLVDVDKRELVTADFTFYNRPVSWWESQLGRRVYLRAAAAHLVEIGTAPKMADAINGQGVAVQQAEVVCKAQTIELQVDWLAVSKPDHDLSVFVHLLDQGGVMIGQADEAAPVYGWRSLTSWEAGEVVHDVYVLPRLPNADTISYGLYRQLASGEFQNEYTLNAAVKCD